MYEVAAYPDPEALPEGFTKLDANENPYGPSPLVISAITNELRFLNRYPTDPSTLKRRIAEYTGTTPDSVVVGNGSDEVLGLLAKAFLNPGDEVVVSIPSFQMYEVVARLAGATVKAVPMLEGFRWDVNGILSAAEEAKMVLLCSPNNPTGNTLTELEAKRLAESDALVVIDEAYVEFAERSLTRLLAERENLVFLRTFSKAFALAGLRVGYALASPETAQLLYRVKPPYNVNRVGLAAAAAALEDLDYMRHLVELTRTARREFTERLEQVEGLRVYRSEANFVLLEVKRPERLRKSLASALWEKGFAVRDCSRMQGLTGSYLRVTVGTRLENERFTECLKSLLEAT
ncbi:MAG: histidinol-phosphate transaminase [Candidatus Bathyarchaeia archaeon]